MHVCRDREVVIKEIMNEMEAVSVTPYRKLGAELKEIEHKLSTAAELLQNQDILKSLTVWAEACNLLSKQEARSNIMLSPRELAKREKIIKDLSVCPCCNGDKIHMSVQRTDEESYEESHDCETCRSTGRL